MDWQPIETAPKDGSTFLTTGMCGYNLARYQRPYKPYKRWFILEEQGTFNSWDTLQERRCTHWMPIPDSPIRGNAKAFPFPAYLVE